MRLLLSSWYLKPDVDRPAVLPPPTGTGRAGIVLNALDQYGHSRDRDLPREVHTWKTFGYTCEELDLRDYFSAPEDLLDRVADFDPQVTTSRRPSPARVSRRFSAFHLHPARGSDRPHWTAEAPTPLKEEGRSGPNSSLFPSRAAAFIKSCATSAGCTTLPSPDS